MAIVAALLVSGTSAGAQANPPFPDIRNAETVMFEGTPLRRLGPSIVYFEDLDPNGLDLARAVRRLAEGPLERIEGDHISGPYATTLIWAAFKLRNDTDTPAVLRPTSNTPWIRDMAFFVLRADHAVDVLHDRVDSTPHLPEDFAGTFMTGRPFSLAPGEEVTFVLRYGSYGIYLLPLSLETPASMADIVSITTIKQVSFFSFAFAVLLLFVGLNIAIEGRATLILAALCVSVLALIAQIDGLLFGPLWPNAPIWNKDASLLFLTITIALAFLTASAMMRLEGNHTQSRLFAIASGLAIAPLAFISLVGPSPVTGFQLAALPFGVASVLWATVMWGKNIRGKAIVAVVTSLSISVVLMFFVFFTLLGAARISFVGHDVAKVLYLLFSITLLAAFTTRARAMSMEYRAALERDVEAARRDAAMSRALLDAEKAYQSARQIAERRRAQLAEASHDLRQPLVSLRMMADRLAVDTGDAERQRLENAFDYFEGVLTENLERTRPEALESPEPSGTEDGEAEGDGAETLETFEINVVLGTIAAMFSQEAASKGIELRIVGSTCEVTSAPTSVLRILSNLVTNALKHAHAGKILVGVRQGGDMVRLVVADNGCGMSAAQLEQSLNAYEKSDASDGEGLGLTIVTRLCADLGLTLQTRTAPGHGMCFVIGLPHG